MYFTRTWLSFMVTVNKLSRRLGKPVRHVLLIVNRTESRTGDRRQAMKDMIRELGEGRWETRDKKREKGDERRRGEMREGSWERGYGRQETKDKRREMGDERQRIWDILGDAWLIGSAPDF